MRAVLQRLPLLLLLAVLAACGAAAQDRPVVVGSFPANGQLLTAGLSEIKVVYDEPVTLLNPYDVQVLASSVQLPAFPSQRPGEPNAVYIQLEPGWWFPADTTIYVQMVQGAVVNAQQHYADEVQVVRFDLGPEPPVPVGHPGKVTLLDVADFTVAASLDTPAGREAVGLLATARGAGRRIWVQLDNGAGTGEALAWFAPTDVAMTPITLATGGGDLTAQSAAIRLGPLGRFLYAAYRHEDTGGVRLYKIDVETGAEVAQLALASVPTSGTTRPAGITIDDTATLLLVSCHDGATGTLAYVDLLGFVEKDRDEVLPGTQGVSLPNGAGALTYVAANSAIAAAGADEVTFVATATDQVVEAPSDLTGTTVDILRTGDGVLLLEPLSGYAQGQALQVRSLLSSYRVATGLVLSDDLGGVSAGATDALAMSALSTQPSFLVLLASPGGRLVTRVTYDFTTLVQDDLNPAITGVQVVDVQAVVPDATVLGHNTGAFAP